MKKICRKTFVLLLMITMIVSCAIIEAYSIQTESVVEWDGIKATWYDTSVGSDSIMLPEDGGEIRIHSTDTFALLRVTLGAEFFADEITSARLFMKPIDRTAPSLQLAQMASTWTTNMTPLDEALDLIDMDSFISANVTNEADGWVSLDVTAFTKAWISGDVRNNGIAIFGTAEAGVSAFHVFDEFSPFIRVTGTVRDRPLDYGRHSFVTVPWEGLGENDAGNCLSYALRDVDEILIDNLGGTYEEVDRRHKAGGVNDIVEYIAELVEQYVADNAETLQISGLRRIESFCAPIDPALEYRIALRVGSDTSLDMPIKTYRDYDYHVWSQLDDGRWTQRFTLGFSEIIVGTNAQTDPGLHFWNMVLDDLWGWGRMMDYYSSKVIYFAVTKDTAEFTAHRESKRYNSSRGFTYKKLHITCDTFLSTLACVCQGRKMRKNGCFTTMVLHNRWGTFLSLSLGFREQISEKHIPIYANRIIVEQRILCRELLQNSDTRVTLCATLVIQ